MRTLFFILVILLISTKCFADVTAEVLSYKIDDNGNIEVHTQYKIDGVEVQSRYPQENGKYYLVTRYQASSFGNMTDNQIKQRILSEVDSHTEALTTQSFIRKQNQVIVNTRLTTLVGSQVIKTQAELGVDTNGDNRADKIWIVKSDGTKVSEKDPTIIP